VRQSVSVCARNATIETSGKPELGPHAACTSLPGLFIGMAMTTRIQAEQIEMTDSLVERFHKKTMQCESGCIEWTGAFDPSGYGKIKIATKSMSTHVAAWRIKNGGIAVPVGRVIMHSCDNRKCVNPLHLSCGTQSENMKDCSTRCRMNTAKGTSNSSSVLTEDIVRQMRTLWDSGSHSQRQIARMFNFGYPVVRAAIERRSWRHV